MMIDWTDVKPSYFEQFIHYVIGKVGFVNREWFGRGGSDKGRDVVAYKLEELPFNFSYQRKWIFQCKRWRKMPTNTQIINEINTASQHKPDFWVMVIPLNPTADQIDFLNYLDSNYPFKIIVIPLVAIQEILHTFPEARNILVNGDLNEGSLDS